MPRLLIPVLFLAATAFANAGHQDAERIEKTWDIEKTKWELAMATAETPEARAKALAARPDLAPYVRDVWAQISPKLAEPWTLPHMAWFLRAAPTVLKRNEAGIPAPLFTKEINAIRQAITHHHLNSPDLSPVCMALSATNDPSALDTLKKIRTESPHPKVQGVAALACAMVMKSLGDEPAILKERLTYIREAVLKSADVDLGGKSVAQSIENETYIIRNLSKGRVAPDLIGTSSTGQPMKLSDSSNKVIILLFWGSNVLDAENTVRITNDLVRKYADKPLVVLGVNKDPAAKLHALESDGTVTWKNFSDADGKLALQYRVGSWPLVYVLDADRKIHYAGAPGSFAELTAEALLAETSATR